jgi:DNA-binding transcriptional MerR regulator
MDTLDTFSIKDMECLTGIKAHTIRIWEKRYGIPDPKRSSTNIRYFDNNDLRLLLTIRMLTNSGLRINAVARMSAADRERHLGAALALNDAHRDFYEPLLISLLQADERKFTGSYTSVVSRLGLEQAFIQCLLPFMERVGLLWQTGTIEPAQEHFFFILVRQKLIAATDALGLPAQTSKGTVLLFLPEHEWHELGLLFYNYALRARGFHTVYLGQSVPLTGLKRIISSCHPDCIVTGMVTAINPTGFAGFRTALGKMAGDIKTFYTGTVPQKARAKYKEMLTTEDLVRWLQTHVVTEMGPARPKPACDPPNPNPE